MPQHDALARPAGDAGPRASLSAHRSEIDRIDDALIGLMEQRLTHSLAIAELKQDAEAALLYLRPRREQEILYRIESKTEHLPKGAINVIWRELMALCLQAQRTTTLVLHAPAQPVLVTNLARLRFGCAAPIIVTGSANEALHRARSSEAVAIIELSPLSHWWVELHDDPILSIFDALAQDENGVSAIAIGRIAADSLPHGTSFPIISEATLRRRTGQGEAIRPLAICGHLRLCVSRSEPPLGTKP